MNPIKISYKPVIDGLRAIAVLSVIFFHLKIDFFKGGYLGVDIFFVISGYLISSLIYKEIEINNSFSFTNFYERRARRILPALIFVIIFCLPISWYYIFPYDFKDYILSLITSIFFSSNFYFYFTRVVYAAEDAILKPFLHTWSLGIEEQFYIFFPIFFILLLKYFRKYSFWIVSIIIVINILFSDWMSKNYFQINHYMIITRGWELMAGVFVCLLEKNNKLNINNFSKNILSTIGLLIIIISIYLFDENTRHPSIITIFPIVGSMLVILFAKNHSITNKILSFKPIVWIGLISYSLYLWHHPILAFKIISNQENNFLLNNYFLTIVIFILSILTYLIIEKPFRNKNFISKNFFILTLFLIIIFLSSLFTFILYKDGLPDRFPKVLQYVDERPYDISKENLKICFQRKKNFCGLSSKIEKSVFLVGDSQVASFSHILSTNLKKINYNLINLTFGNSCYYAVGFHLNGFCDSKSQSIRKNEIYKKPGSVVILGYTSTFTGEEQKSKALFSINELLENDYKVILVYPYTTFQENISSLLKKTYFEDRKAFEKNIPITIRDYGFHIDTFKDTIKFLDSIDHKNLTRIYQTDIVCDNNLNSKCFSNDEQNIYTVDRSHPSSYTAELIVKKILKQISKY